MNNFVETDVFLWTVLFENCHKRRSILTYPSYNSDEKKLALEIEHLFEGVVIEVKDKQRLYLKEF